MNWIELKNETDLNELKQLSAVNPVLIFKHSTRCSISSMALNRLERSWSSEAIATVQLYYLDLIQNRIISNLITETFNVQHQSPQVILIKNGEAIYHESHMNIDFDSIKDVVKN